MLRRSLLQLIGTLPFLGLPKLGKDKNTSTHWKNGPVDVFLVEYNTKKFTTVRGGWYPSLIPIYEVLETHSKYKNFCYYNDDIWQVYNPKEAGKSHDIEDMVSKLVKGTKEGVYNSKKDTTICMFNSRSFGLAFPTKVDNYDPVKHKSMMRVIGYLDIEKIHKGGSVATNLYIMNYSDIANQKLPNLQKLRKDINV